MAPSAYASCPNEEIRAQEPFAANLPDCRAYEQVSPLDKNGVDAVGGLQGTRTSPTGASVYYFSEAPFPQATGSSIELPYYLSSRSQGWLTSGLTPPTEPTPAFEQPSVYLAGLTGDLARTVVVEQGEMLAPGATPGQPNAYLRDNSTGAYQLLAGDLTERLFVAGATPGGSRILFETRGALPVSSGPQPAPGVQNLYEWNEAKPPAERLSIAGLLPASEGGEAPAGGSLAGAGGDSTQSYTQNTISQDGSRVFFTDAGSGRVYMREPRAEPPVTIPISQGPATWQAATPSGSFVFYVEAGELYRFNVDAFQKSVLPEPQALLEAREPLTSGAEGVRGTLGVSDDGAYAYFVAPGVLATNEREYTNAKDEPVVEEALEGASNLYEWHQGAPSPLFIAGLNAEEDAADWSGAFSPDVLPPAGGAKGARVTPDGSTVLFASVASLTGYENGTECNNGHNHISRPCDELFRYVVGSGRLICVSCNPTRASATEETYLTKKDPALSVNPNLHVNAFLTRNLSADGSRVFFETEEALLPADINNDADVYEWERPGAGSCTESSPAYFASNGGCLYLISTGAAHSPSFFGDASESGEDVLFFTRQPLVGQDQDDNQDLYDARLGGGIAAQNPPPPSPCAGDACRSAGEAPPTFGASSSATLSGAGNLRRTCARGRRLRHGRCVKARRDRKSKADRAGHRRGVRR